MGLNGSRVIQIKNVQAHRRQCEELGRKICPIYGELEFVRYQGMQFNIAESQNDAAPHPMSLHYLVVPNLLLFPDFTLLEDICPSSLQELLEIIKGVSEMGVQGGAIGIGRGRIGYRDRWGIVGEREVSWTYDQVFGGQIEGVYFSPQQMICLSQNREAAKYDIVKSDVFSFGMMLVEIIFGQDLSHIYDYDNFEIRLNPLLQKLQRIKQEFGQQVSRMFVGMLQIEQDDRCDFGTLLSYVEDLLTQKSNLYMMSSNSSQRNIELSRGNRTPARQSNYNTTSKTPKADKSKYRNDVSPFRGRFGSNVKNNGDRQRKTPERPQESRSPMRRNLQINTRGDTYASSRNMITPKQLDFQSNMRQGFSPISRR